MHESKLFRTNQRHQKLLCAVFMESVLLPSLWATATATSPNCQSIVTPSSRNATKVPCIFCTEAVFMKLSTLLLGCAAACSLVTASSAAEHRPLFGPRDPFKHIVIIYEENHS